MKIRQQTKAKRLTKTFRRMLTMGLLGMVWLLNQGADGASWSARSQRQPTTRPSTRSSSSRTNATDLSELGAFNIISERNIFNPNRGPKSSGTFADAPPPKIAKVESVSLVGTLIHGNGMIAFFDGSGSSFKKAVKPSDTIAGYKVIAVAPESVWLKMGGKEVEMKVGMEMRRQDEGEWKLSGKAAASQPSATSASSDKSPGEDSGGGDEDDVVKKMIARREQENSK